LEQCDNILTTVTIFVGTLELAKGKQFFYGNRSQKKKKFTNCTNPTTTDKTKKGQEVDVMQVIEVLKKCVVLLVIQIKNRWKFQELCK